MEIKDKIAVNITQYIIMQGFVELYAKQISEI